MVHKYNNYVTRKIPYKRMLNGTKIVELFKQPLSIVYRGKETNALLARTNITSVTWRVGKSKGLQD